MSTSSSEPTGKAGSEQPGRDHLQPPATPRSTLSERIEARRRDPEFQKRLKQNLKRHAKLLGRLADY